MLRYAILALCVSYLVLLAVLAVAVWRATPGPPDQAIAGIGIGSHGVGPGIAYLSGRRLTCVPDVRDGLPGSRCRVMVAGKALEIGAWRNPPGHPNQLGGRCEARYAGTLWPCRVDSRHVHVHWFAYLDFPPGLRQEQLDALRREYYFENLGEEPYLAAVLVLPPLTAIAVAGTVLATFRPWARPGPGVPAAISGAVAALLGTFFATLFLTGGFWD